MKINVNFTLNIDIDKYAKGDKEKAEIFLNAPKEKHFELISETLKEIFTVDEISTVDINSLEVEK